MEGKLVSLLNSVIPKDGVAELLPGINAGRSEVLRKRFPLIYNPSVCIVAQGRKNVYLGREIIPYDPLNYLVVTLPAPLEAEIVAASPEEPFLVLTIEIDLSMVGRLLSDMEELQAFPEPLSPPSPAVFSSSMNDEMLRTVERLIQTSGDPLERRILASGIKKELYFHILRGRQGKLLRDFVRRGGASYRIAGVVQTLQRTFSENHSISSIAESAGMGTSTLHHCFLKMVGQSPMQYLKKIRLHRAKLLLVSEGLNVSEAAYRVGYQSSSQFNREFKRLFRQTPGQIARNASSR